MDPINKDLAKSHLFHVEGDGKMTPQEAAFRLNVSVAELPPPDRCNGRYSYDMILRLVMEKNAGVRRS